MNTSEIIVTNFGKKPPSQQHCSFVFIQNISCEGCAYGKLKRKTCSRDQARRRRMMF